jgi:hypothetical protein
MSEKMICPDCGIEMNHHADKIDYGAPFDRMDPEFGGVMEEFHTCRLCGKSLTRHQELHS